MLAGCIRKLQLAGSKLLLDAADTSAGSWHCVAQGPAKPLCLPWGAGQRRPQLTKQRGAWAPPASNSVCSAAHDACNADKQVPSPLAGCTLANPCRQRRAYMSCNSQQCGQYCIGLPWPDMPAGATACSGHVCQHGPSALTQAELTRCTVVAHGPRPSPPLLWDSGVPAQCNQA